MAERLEIRIPARGRHLALAGEVIEHGEAAVKRWDSGSTFDDKGSAFDVELLLALPEEADSAYLVGLSLVQADHRELLQARRGSALLVAFAGRSPVRRRLREVRVRELQDDPPAALDLNAQADGAEPLWLLPSGALSTDAEAAPEPAQLLAVLVTAARWVSSRATSTFARLYPASAFHPERPARTERMTLAQARGLIEQLQGALRHAAVGGEHATAAPQDAVQLRSACLTVLSHLLATAADDPAFESVSDEAAAMMFALADAERDKGRPELFAHAARLLALRGPVLLPADQKRALALVRSLVRAAPPYAEMTGDWNFAMCLGDEFHEGTQKILTRDFDFKEVDVPEDTPAPPPRYGGGYRAFEAPFKTPSGKHVRIFCRKATPYNENHEMGETFFTGIFINRHSQLGSFDMRAATVNVEQRGYKLMINGQCAGLTTRFAITQMFPDADIYSSWDSTYYRKSFDGVVAACEVIDCLVAALRSMVEEETHEQIAERMRRKQWHHKQASFRDYHQFIGPSHPLVISRFDDINRDGRADCYDGFLDFTLQKLAEELRGEVKPIDPGLAPSQIGGAAADGLNWAAGSLNRVAQYSDVWSGLRGKSDLFYAFQSFGFYDQAHPPQDVVSEPLSPPLGLLPAVCRYRDSDDEAGLRGEVMMHSHFSHLPRELKRLLCAADAINRAFAQKLLKVDNLVDSRAGRRAALLLTLAGLLKYPADQNRLDALWSAALKILELPPLSRSQVSRHITKEDRNRSNYYGSRRGVRALLDALRESEPLAYDKLHSEQPEIGRAAALEITDSEEQEAPAAQQQDVPPAKGDSEQQDAPE